MAMAAFEHIEHARRLTASMFRDRRARSAGPPAFAIRCFDAIGALTIGALTAPVWITAAVLIRLLDGSPVLHAGIRVGRDAEPFVLLKFRTMKTQDATSANSAAVTALGDPRVTRLGAWLRRTKIDELPQVLNVLRGDMSLVGPRPEDPRYVRLYSTEHTRLLSVKPGLTSPASIAYRNEEAVLAHARDPEVAYVEEVLPAKLALDLQWLDHRSLRNDIDVLVQTARVLGVTARHPTDGRTGR
jgi:lipopolysaccharide/colanic/teichoic acid biosynthesis glycosyltransferase